MICNFCVFRKSYEVETQKGVVDSEEILTFNPRQPVGNSSVAFIDSNIDDLNVSTYNSNLMV